MRRDVMRVMCVRQYQIGGSPSISVLRTDRERDRTLGSRPHCQLKSLEIHVRLCEYLKSNCETKTNANPALVRKVQVQSSATRPFIQLIC